MKFFQVAKFSHREDYGHEWYVQFFFTDQWALLQTSISWNNEPMWPYIQITSGSGTTLGILFWVYKFGLDVDILSRTWNWSYEQENELV